MAAPGARNSNNNRGCLSWTGLGLALVLWILSTLILLGLETGSALVRSKILPLRRELTAVSCQPQAENEGALIHIDCPITRVGRLRPPAAFRANLPDGFKGVFFEMQVELFQRAVQPGFVASGFRGVWSDHILATPDSGSPDFMPHVEGMGRQFAPAFYGGDFRIDPQYLVNFRRRLQLRLSDDEAYVPSRERPPTIIDSRNTQVYENRLYTGDPLRPAVGDVRITFYGSAATHVSAIGRQGDFGLREKLPYKPDWLESVLPAPTAALVAFPDPLPPRQEAASNNTGKGRLLIMEGDLGAKEMLEAYERSNDVCGAYLRSARFGFSLATAALFWGFSRVWRMDSISQRPAWVSALCAGFVALGSVFLLAGLFRLPSVAVDWLTPTASLLAGVVLLGLTVAADSTFAPKSRRRANGYQRLPAAPAAKPAAAPVPPRSGGKEYELVYGAEAASPPHAPPMGWVGMASHTVSRSSQQMHPPRWMDGMGDNASGSGVPGATAAHNASSHSRPTPSGSYLAGL